MTALDVLLLIIAATALFLGWRAGFIAQIGKFAAVVAAIICCRLFGRRVAVWLVNANCSPGDSFDGATLWTIVAYAAIFISVYLLVSFLGSGLRRIVHAVLTPLVDRLAGALFKLLVYMLFVSLVLNLACALSRQQTTVRCGGVLARTADRPEYNHLRACSHRIAGYGQHHGFAQRHHKHLREQRLR